ncbi:DUF3243 domain-containing protein [Bacillaceae bacterium]
MSVLKDFGQWKNFLADRVRQAQKMGMNEETMAEIAAEIGDYLAAKVDPQNDEERLLKDLWDVGNEEEQKAMASMMIKYVQKQ